jgi:hypothetical protein
VAGAGSTDVKTLEKNSAIERSNEKKIQTVSPTVVSPVNASALPQSDPM